MVKRYYGGGEYPVETRRKNNERSFSFSGNAFCNNMFRLDFDSQFIVKVD
jgi:hypothetical protein